jgi:hypothetical protein
MELVQITGWIDQGLNEKAYIIPGLGDFGERRWLMFTFYCYIFLTIEQGIANNQSWPPSKLLGCPPRHFIRNHGPFFFSGHVWHKNLSPFSLHETLHYKNCVQPEHLTNSMFSTWWCRRRILQVIKVIVANAIITYVLYI